MILARDQFKRGLVAPFVAVWDTVTHRLTDDPTCANRGIVAEFTYAPKLRESQSSYEQSLSYDRSANPLRAGGSLYFRGDVYFTKPPAGAEHDNRKLVDFVGDSNQGMHTRVTLHRRSYRVYCSVMGWWTGQLREESHDTGIEIPDEKWTTLEVYVKLNTSFTRADGKIRVYKNKEQTATYTREQVGLITNKYLGYPMGSFLSVFSFGSQLTIDAGRPIYTEKRLWDNITFSTTRMPR